MGRLYLSDRQPIYTIYEFNVKCCSLYLGDSKQHLAVQQPCYFEHNIECSKA